MRKAEFNPVVLVGFSHRAAVVGAELPSAGHRNLKACWKMRLRHCAFDNRQASWASDFHNFPKENTHANSSRNRTATGQRRLGLAFADHLVSQSSSTTPCSSSDRSDARAPAKAKARAVGSLLAADRPLRPDWRFADPCGGPLARQAVTDSLASNPKLAILLASFGSHQSARIMLTVNVHQAKTQLSRLLARVEAGEEVVIARRGEPVVRLVSCKARGKRQPDALKGKLVVPDSFFDPLPEEELNAWEGR